MRLLKKNKKGYLLKVDKEYPRKLHDKHSNLPFMSEKIKIDKVKKLIPSLWNKEKYVLHVRSLHQALRHGLILKKVHRVIRFLQSP